MKVLNQKRKFQTMSKSQNKIFQILLFFVLIAFMACSGRPNNVLSARKMEKLLVDIHLLEGTMNMLGYGNVGEEDRKVYFESLFQDYGITASDFDSCLVWYTSNPKKFERIYIKVNNRLDLISEDVAANLYHLHDTVHVRDMWYKTRRYIFGPDSARKQLDETLNLTYLLPNDRYELSFLHRVAPSDSSVNHHAVMYINYDNGEVDSVYTKTMNDSVLRRYTLRLKARKMLYIKSVQVKLLGVDSVKGKMHAVIDSIKLLRTFNPQMQDSIKAYLERTDSSRFEQVELELDKSLEKESLILLED